MKKIIFTLSMIVASISFTFAQQTTTTAPTQNDNGPVITFEKLVHDYGTVTKGADGNCEFKFTNTGKEPLILSNVQTSCGCTVPSWPKDPILPGKTASIKVNYTKMNIVSTISKQITVYSNATNGTIVLSIKGTVVESTETTTPK
jgi:hypothetical protein